MKIKFCHIVFVLGCILSSQFAFAQEGADSMEPEIKSSFMPSGESSKYDSRDSIYSHPAVQPRTTESSKNSNTSGAKEDESDDSVLSFNFLYYIIQKYKMSDIVDP